MHWRLPLGHLVLPAQGTAVPLGPNPVRIVNPEGCTSQESVSVNVLPARACGLLGIEPFFLIGLMGLRRMRQRTT